MNRRAFLAAVAAAILAGPKALASLIEQHRAPQWALHREWMSVEEVMHRYGQRDAFYAEFSMPYQLVPYTRPEFPRGSFHEFERRVRAMGFAS